MTTPVSGPPSRRPHPAGERRRPVVVDAMMCALAAAPIAAVLLDEGDLFLMVAALLPVAVMIVCSFDPPDIAQMAARMRDARRMHELHYPGDPRDDDRR